MSDHNSPPRETIIRAVSPAVEFRDASAAPRSRTASAMALAVLLGQASD
jgi:hypothetical protein